MGNGKTLYATIKAWEYRQKYPNNTIYSNYHINLPNTVYTKYGILPIETIKKGKCMIILDDFKALKVNIEAYSEIIVLWSRKTEMDVYLTCQYYTHVPKEIRELSEWEIRPSLSKSKKTMRVFKKDVEYNFQKSYIRNVDKFWKYYDTNEIVDILVESEKLKAIKSFSRNNLELEKNIAFITNNQSLRKKYYKELCFA